MLFPGTNWVRHLRIWFSHDVVVVGCCLCVESKENPKWSEGICGARRDSAPHMEEGGHLWCVSENSSDLKYFFNGSCCTSEF